jgi:hypothetical protein
MVTDRKTVGMEILDHFKRCFMILEKDQKHEWKAFKRSPSDQVMLSVSFFPFYAIRCHSKDTPSRGVLRPFEVFARGEAVL